jgi:hypothetical protein
MQHDVASVDAKVMVDGKPAEGEFFWLMVVQLKLKGIVTQILVMEAEVPVDAPVDVTNEAVAIEVDEVEVQNVDVDDAIIELSKK